VQYCMNSFRAKVSQIAMLHCVNIICCPARCSVPIQVTLQQCEEQLAATERNLSEAQAEAKDLAKQKQGLERAVHQAKEEVKARVLHTGNSQIQKQRPEQWSQEGQEQVLHQIVR
jgi:hypothetical protein